MDAPAPGTTPTTVPTMLDQAISTFIFAIRRTTTPSTFLRITSGAIDLFGSSSKARMLATVNRPRSAGTSEMPPTRR